MVHVVLAEIVFWQICDVRLLDMRNVRGPEYTDIHLVQRVEYKA